MATMRSDPSATGKRSAIAALYAVAVLITILGLGFAVYSFIFHVNYTVFNMEIPGFVFAVFVVFLGVRYIRAVHKMNKTLSDSQKFNWSNFRIGSRAKKMEG